MLFRLSDNLAVSHNTNLLIFECLKMSKNSGITHEEVFEFFETFIHQDDAEVTKSKYNECATKYDEMMTVTGYNGPKILIKYFLSLNLPKDVRILDVACGSGKVGELLRAAGYTNVDALDGSEEMLQVAKSKNLYKNYCQFIVTGPFPLERVYDVVLQCGGIGHGHMPAETVEYMCKVAKPGGQVINHYWAGITDEFVGGEKNFENLCFFNGKMTICIDRMVATGLVKRKRDRYFSDEFVWLQEPFALDHFEVLK